MKFRESGPTAGFNAKARWLIFICLSISFSALAADWVERPFSKFRLWPSTTAIDASTEIVVGLKVKLEPGWQFYGKDPGKYGIAPKFDWSASTNLSSATIYWPQPTRHVYSVSPPVSTLGYKDSVLLPIVIEPANANEDVVLHSVLQYAICADYCVKDTVDIHLTLPSGDGKPTPHSVHLRQVLSTIRSSP